MSPSAFPNQSSGKNGSFVMYTTEEAAERLRVRKSWLERQAAARKIPFTMLAGSYRFTEEHIAEIIRMHEVRPAVKRAITPAASSRRARRPPKHAAASHQVTPLRARPSACRKRGV